jgi:hypothetical protein
MPITYKYNVLSTTIISNVLISNFKSTIINLNKCGLQNWPPFPQ